MGAENHTLAFGNLGEGFDENRALLFQGLQHETVVHYLMANVKRTPISAQGAADRLDRAIDTRTKPTGLGKNNFFNHSLA